MTQCDTALVPRATTFSWMLSVNSSPEVPRFIIVGFQTGKSGNQNQNPSIFDNVNIRNIYVMLNSNKYPTLDYTIFLFRHNDLVESMVMPLNLDLSFLI